MRKNQKFTTIVKGALATALSLSMIVTSLAVMPAVAEADDAVPVKVLDFEKGIREFRGFNFDMETQDFPEGDGDDNFDIIKSPNVMLQKVGDQLGATDKVDANNFVYTGTGELAIYHTTVTSNQPTTMYDDVKGTVYVLFDTVELKELKKEVSANVMIPPASDAPDATATPDEKATAALDSARPVNTVVREAMKIKCAMQISNPLAGSTSDAVTVTYWVYVPEGTAKDAALMVFENAGEAEGAVNVTELFGDADSTVAPAGTWAHVAMVVTADGAKFYVNGAETTESYVLGDASVAAFTTPTKVLLGGSANGQMDTVYDTRLDDVSFYEVALTADQIKAAYDADVAEMSAGTDVTAPDKVFKLEDLSEVTDLGDESISIVDETIEGKAVKVIKVAENKRTTTKTGFQLNENPFAGQQLDGITVGYWVKQATDASTSLMFMDDLKTVYNHKEPEHSGNARSWLFIDNTGAAAFEEGSYYDVAGKVKNTYSFAPTLTEEEGNAAKEKFATWQYVTLTATNKGIQVYVNGEKLTNQVVDVTGVRFLDGYYASVADLTDPESLNGVFGGTNNQMATHLMSFLGYEDTKVYFGWMPTNDRLNVRGGESWYHNVSFYKSAMDDEEVAALYTQAVGQLGGEVITPSESPQPSDKPAVLYGDVDASGAVEASDALLVLKAVVKLETLSETQTVAADVDGKEGIEAADALEILKKVVKLIDKFPVEK